MRGLPMLEHAVPVDCMQLLVAVAVGCMLLLLVDVAGCMQLLAVAPVAFSCLFISVSSCSVGAPRRWLAARPKCERGPRRSPTSALALPTRVFHYASNSRKAAIEQAGNEKA
eukprot:4145188-Pyramimonas_sp.AAC.1